nr:cell division protein SepF [Actinopolyspora biskrensis]
MTPTTYVEAREIGDHVRAHTPVLLDLTQMTEANAKRLVDFTAGSAYAASGTMPRVRARLFLVRSGGQTTRTTTGSGVSSQT